MCTLQAMQNSAAGAENSRRIASLVQAALLLREALAALPALTGALAPAQSELFKAVCFGFPCRAAQCQGRVHAFSGNLL